jgi:hypothetical protein
MRSMQKHALFIPFRDLAVSAIPQSLRRSTDPLELSFGVVCGLSLRPLR